MMKSSSFESPKPYLFAQFFKKSIPALINLGSKEPYFIPYRGKWAYLFLAGYISTIKSNDIANEVWVIAHASLKRISTETPTEPILTRPSIRDFLRKYQIKASKGNSGKTPKPYLFTSSSLYGLEDFLNILNLKKIFGRKINVKALFEMP